MTHRKSRTAIKIDSAQEMVTAREVLRALGFEIYHGLNVATHMENYNALHVDVMDNGSNDVARGFISGSSVTKRHETLQSFLDEHFQLKTPTQVELEKLEASAEALNKQITALKATIA